MVFHTKSEISFFNVILHNTNLNNTRPRNDLSAYNTEGTKSENTSNLYVYSI